MNALRSYEIVSVPTVSTRDMSFILGVSENDISEKLSDSDICFGTNDMTLVSLNRFCEILGVSVPTDVPSGVMVNVE